MKPWMLNREPRSWPGRHADRPFDGFDLAPLLDSRLPGKLSAQSQFHVNFSSIAARSHATINVPSTPSCIFESGRSDNPDQTARGRRWNRLEVDAMCPFTSIGLCVLSMITLGAPTQPNHDVALQLISHTANQLDGVTKVVIDRAFAAVRPGDRLEGARISLNLSAGQTFIGIVERLETARYSDCVWLGRIEGELDGRFMLVVNRDAVVGEIVVGQGFRPVQDDLVVAHVHAFYGWRNRRHR